MDAFLGWMLLGGLKRRKNFRMGTFLRDRGVYCDQGDWIWGGKGREVWGGVATVPCASGMSHVPLGSFYRVSAQNTPLVTSAK